MAFTQQKGGASCARRPSRIPTRGVPDDLHHAPAHPPDPNRFGPCHRAGLHGAGNAATRDACSRARRRSLCGLRDPAQEEHHSGRLVHHPDRSRRARRPRGRPAGRPRAGPGSPASAGWDLLAPDPGAARSPGDLRRRRALARDRRRAGLHRVARLGARRSGAARHRSNRRPEGCRRDRGLRLPGRERRDHHHDEAGPVVGAVIFSPVTQHHRRKTVVVAVGGVKVGGRHPIVVQSMTNTDTADVAATVAQVRALHQAGSELVRVTVNNDDAARSVPEIVAQVDVPVIGDFHYNGHLLLTKYPACARALAKYRINPGNVGAKRRDDNFRTIVQVAVAEGKPVRIGVNWGSLDQQLLTEMMDVNAGLPEPRDARDVTMEAMVASATRSAELAEECGLSHDRIILSAKVSGVQDLVEVYRKLARLSDYPLHLGLTEAGMGAKGIIASAAGLSILLQEGIGDTIRVSLTPRPGGDRTEEVQVAQQVLQSLGLRSFTPQVSACPGCGRTTSTFFQEMAEEIQTYLRNQMPVWKAKYAGVAELKVAVMGCVVNGPGESKHADIGISLPGTFEEPKAPVYVDGQLKVTLKGDRIVAEFLEILDAYVENRYAASKK